jgi:hypothetical protein
MGMFDGGLMRWLGKPDSAAAAQKKARAEKARAARAAPPNSTQFAQSQDGSGTSGGNGGPTSVRKDLLRLVLRETLVRNGIPSAWIAADMLRTSSPRRDQGLHVRLMVKHWDPRIVLHGVALEQDFLQRLLLLDPNATNWLMGFSWQFALDDRSACPALPHPGSWTSDAAPAAAPEGHVTRPGDVIEGPVFIPQSQDDVRADLERLLALRDDDLKRHGPGEDGFAATRPVSL